MRILCKKNHCRPQQQVTLGPGTDPVFYFGHLALIETYSLISSFSNFLTSSRLVRYFRLTAPAAVLGHLGAISLKNLTKRKEVRKGADQANCRLAHDKSLETCKRGHSLLFSYHQAISSSRSLAKFFFLSNILSFFTTCRDSY